MDGFNQFDALLFHIHHHHIDLTAQMAIENQRGYRDRNAGCGVLQRHRDTMRQLRRVLALRTGRAEDFDHADDGAEQAQQRCDG